MKRPQISLLERLRRDMGWSISDLHNKSGVAISMISQYESGKRRPSDDTASRMAEALMVRPAVLLADFAQRFEQSAS